MSIILLRLNNILVTCYMLKLVIVANHSFTKIWKTASLIRWHRHMVRSALLWVYLYKSFVCLNTMLLHLVAFENVRLNFSPFMMMQRSVSHSASRSRQEVIHGHWVWPGYCAASVRRKEMQEKGMSHFLAWKEYLEAFFACWGTILFIIAVMGQHFRLCNKRGLNFNVCKCAQGMRSFMLLFLC